MREIRKGRPSNYLKSGIAERDTLLRQVQQSLSNKPLYQQTILRVGILSSKVLEISTLYFELDAFVKLKYLSYC